MKNMILYHANCPDGAMAAAVILQALQDRGETADLISVTYQKPLSDFITPEKVQDTEIYIVDFSFSPEETNQLAKMTKKKVFVLDHHESAIQKYEKAFQVSRARNGIMLLHYKNIELTFNLNHSGAALAWQFFHLDSSTPTLIAHVEDYDLWKHTFPDSRAIHAFLRSLDMDVLKYVDLLNTGKKFLNDGGDPKDSLKPLLIAGHAILRINDQQVNIFTSHPEIVNFDGLTALAVNAPLHQDDIGARLATQCPSGVGIIWYWRERKYKISLRSRPVENHPPFDCSSIAMKYGGGGHVGAASFLCDELPWKK